MLRILTKDKHKQPFKGPITITRIQAGEILEQELGDTAFGALSIIDHAVMQKRLTIKLHEHVNDEILSYVWKGRMYHKDSVGHEAPITPGRLMMMNAGFSFWHEEKVKEDEVEMLQIFVRPRKKDLDPNIQFHEKPVSNRNWYLMVGPEYSHAPLHVRQNVYIYDSHPREGEELELPIYEGYQPFIYVMDWEIAVGNHTIHKYEAVTDMENILPTIHVNKNSTLVLFLVDMDAPMSMAGTISGSK